MANLILLHIKVDKELCMWPLQLPFNLHKESHSNGFITPTV